VPQPQPRRAFYLLTPKSKSGRTRPLHTVDTLWNERTGVMRGAAPNRCETGRRQAQARTAAAASTEGKQSAEGLTSPRESPARGGLGVGAVAEPKLKRRGEATDSQAAVLRCEMMMMYDRALTWHSTQHQIEAENGKSGGTQGCGAAVGLDCS
jgi:hypothetical protein